MSVLKHMCCVVPSGVWSTSTSCLSLFQDAAFHRHLVRHIIRQNFQLVKVRFSRPNFPSVVHQTALQGQLAIDDIKEVTDSKQFCSRGLTQASTSKAVYDPEEGNASSSHRNLIELSSCTLCTSRQASIKL